MGIETIKLGPVLELSAEYAGTAGANSFSARALTITTSPSTYKNGEAVRVERLISQK
jgi:hypothetical protein